MFLSLSSLSLPLSLSLTLSLLSFFSSLHKTAIQSDRKQHPIHPPNVETGGIPMTSTQLKCLWIFWNSWPSSPSPPQGLFPGQSLRSSAEDQLAFASYPGPPCPLAPAHLSTPADGKPADRERLPQGPGQCDVFEHLTHFNGSSGFSLPC